MHGKKERQRGPTISRVHQNAAAWHYNLAHQAWDIYNHCLDNKGLYHPDFVNVVRNALSDFWRHTRIADGLMRIRSVYNDFGMPATTKKNTRQWSEEFEKALAQRGANAKAGVSTNTEVVKEE